MREVTFVKLGVEGSGFSFGCLTLSFLLALVSTACRTACSRQAHQPRHIKQPSGARGGTTTISVDQQACLFTHAPDSQEADIP